MFRDVRDEFLGIGFLDRMLENTSIFISQFKSLDD